MWKNSLKNVESDKNNILYVTLLDFFLQRNGTYFLNKSRISDKVIVLCILSFTFLNCKLEVKKFCTE